MKLAATIALLLCSVFAHGQYTYFVAAMPHDTGNPSATPSASGSRIRIDQPTRRLWVWNSTTSQWVKLGQGIDIIVGCTAPNYTPIVGQSDFAINSCATPELYHYSGTGTVWNCMTCGSGSTVTTDATLSGDGSGGDPLAIAQQAAVTSQVLEWTGATWEPSWGNPYTFVTTGATITTAVNEVLIGTVGADVVMGLPTCDATTAAKRFKFVKNGGGSFSVTIEPSGVQQFYPAIDRIVQIGPVSIDCTCALVSGTYYWFFDNF